MRKIIVMSFVTLDGIVQAPGGPEEDRSGGFPWGGWAVAYIDETIFEIIQEFMAKPYALLLGRRTYEIFAAHWPYAPKDDPFAERHNQAHKYVVSEKALAVPWENTTLISGDVAATITNLKADDGPDLQVHGSGNLIQTLLRHDLIDEFRIITIPIVLGKGKRLFGADTLPFAFGLVANKTASTGVVVSIYERAGEVQIGTTEFDTPTEAEIARRQRLAAED